MIIFMELKNTFEGRIPGIDLLSQASKDQVPSTLKSLTAVFGMGTGVASSLKTPGILSSKV